MSELAVMPMEDYKAICDEVRHRADKVIINNKVIYPTEETFTEILTFGILTLGESYRVKYTDSSSLINDEGGIYKVQNINVNGKDVLGFEVVCSKSTIYIYQEPENIMIYVPYSDAYSKNEAVYITLERITGKILSGDLPEKIKETVYEAGKTSKWNEFWNLYQFNGTRTNYLRAFYQFGWNDITYNPKYPIICDSNYAEEMFAWADITDTKVPVKIRGTVAAGSVFLGCQDLVTIRNLDISEYEGTFNKWFIYCNKLKNLNVTGTIKNNLDLSPCKELTQSSYYNVLTNLKDFRQIDTLTAEISYGQQYSPIEIAKGTIEEGKEYTWSYYDNLYNGWVVDNPTSYPSTSETWITSTAGKVIVNGKEYIGFKASFLNYPDQNQEPFTICIYQDGNKIMAIANKGMASERVDIIKINQIKHAVDTRTITMPLTVKDNGNALETDITEAEAKGWEIKWS